MRELWSTWIIQIVYFIILASSLVLGIAVQTDKIQQNFSLENFIRSELNFEVISLKSMHRQDSMLNIVSFLLICTIERFFGGFVASLINHQY